MAETSKEASAPVKLSEKRTVKEREVSRKEALPQMARAKADLDSLEKDLAQAKTDEERTAIREKMYVAIANVPLTTDWNAGDGLAVDTNESLC